MKKGKKLFYNMILMTATALLIRTAGVFFSAYLFRTVGSVGIGIYQLIMSVYTLAITIATSGIKFTATRLVSEELGKGNPAGVRKALRSCLMYSLLFSFATAALLFFGAEWIGTVWLDDPRTVSSLRILPIGLPFIAVSAVVGGYLTAVRQVNRCAFIQIADQFVMIAVTITGLRLLLPKGLEYGCIAMVAGSCLSEAAACLFLFLCCLWDQKKRGASGDSGHGIPKRMFKIAIPIALSAYARSALSTLQHILIPRGLKKWGASQEQAFTAYGTVHGMVLPLVLYPSALLTVLAELLIPELTECQVQNNEERISWIVTRVLKLSFLFAVCVMGVLFCFSEPLGLTFYQSGEVSFYVKLFSPLVLVMYMDTIVDGMLKGLGEQYQSMKYNVIDSFASVCMVYFLLPIFGIKGYVMTVMVSEVLNFSLSLGRLIKITRLQVSLKETVIKPLCCVACTAVTCGILWFPGSWTNEHFPEILAVRILFLIGCYLLFLFLFSCLKKEDLKWFVSLLH
ncbi:oligosaccharide flippase family protein [Massiliimalia timonensis]|uniref:oligosaccharide flippase family protein n=1 Tax=Massiliimalia timonensis TaxID=1987501 RepID=UPI0018A065F5|nr:oligosaccharide flippase family protein [Massiliimalia timonensis]